MTSISESPAIARVSTTDSTTTTVTQKERLFWLLWRMKLTINKIIWHHVQSSLGPPSILYKQIGYQQTFSMIWLVKNRYYKLLEYRLKRGDHVEFCGYGIQILFQSIKKGEIEDGGESLFKLLMSGPYKKNFWQETKKSNQIHYASPAFIKLIINDPQTPITNPSSLVKKMLFYDNIESVMIIANHYHNEIILSGLFRDIRTRKVIQHLIPLIRIFLKPQPNELISLIGKDPLEIDIDKRMDAFEYLLSMNIVDQLSLTTSSNTVGGYFKLVESQLKINHHKDKISKVGEEDESSDSDRNTKINNDELYSIGLTDQDKMMNILEVPLSSSNNDRFLKFVYLLTKVAGKINRTISQLIVKYNIDNCKDINDRDVHNLALTYFEPSLLDRFFKVNESLNQTHMPNRMEVGNLDKQKYFIAQIFAHQKYQLRHLFHIFKMLIASKGEGVLELLEYACMLYQKRGLDPTSRYYLWTKFDLQSEYSLESLQVLNRYGWIPRLQIVSHNCSLEFYKYFFENGGEFRGTLAPYITRAFNEGDLSTAHTLCKTVVHHWLRCGGRKKCRSSHIIYDTTWHTIYDLRADYLDKSEQNVLYFFNQRLDRLPTFSIDDISKHMVDHHMQFVHSWINSSRLMT